MFACGNVRKFLKQTSDLHQGKKARGLKETEKFPLLMVCPMLIMEQLQSGTKSDVRPLKTSLDNKSIIGHLGVRCMTLIAKP